MTTAGNEATAIRSGDRIIARDAFGLWHKGVASSEVESEVVTRDLPGGPRQVRIHDFPVIWVCLIRGGEPQPWPAADVQIRPTNG